MTSNQQPLRLQAQSQQPEINYKVFVRVPFARGQFVDPPDPKWSPAKDRELWRVISSTTTTSSSSNRGGRDTDWHALADRFEVTLPFLLQQAAWLYERQLSQVREQLRRVNKPITSTHQVSAATSPVIDSATASAVGAQPMRRLGSAASGARMSSNLSVRPRTSLDGNRDVGSAAANQTLPGQQQQQQQHQVAQRAAYSRQASTNTITQTSRPAFTSEAAAVAADRAQQQQQQHAGGPRRLSTQASNDSVKRRVGSGKGVSVTAHGQQQQQEQQQKQQPASAETSPKASPSPPDSSSSSSADEAGHGLTHSRAFTRRPQFSRILKKGKSKGKGKASGAGRLSSVVSEGTSEENLNDPRANDSNQDDDDDDSDDDSDSEYLPFASTAPRQSQQASGSKDKTSSGVSAAGKKQTGTITRKAAQNLHIRSGTATQETRPDLPNEPKTPRAIGAVLSSSSSEAASGGTSSSLFPESSGVISGSGSQQSTGPESTPNNAGTGLGLGAGTFDGSRTRKYHHHDHRSPLNALSPKQRRSVTDRSGTSPGLAAGHSGAGGAMAGALAATGGSDTGSPSMGSSFSDLDDASVNTSAMEEALANQMRGGGGGGAGGYGASTGMGGFGYNGGAGYGVGGNGAQAQGGFGAGASSALRSSLAMGMGVGGRFGGLWKGSSGGSGAGGGGNNGQGSGQ